MQTQPQTKTETKAEATTPTTHSNATLPTPIPPPQTETETPAATPTPTPRYDHIVSNPPYFSGSLTSPDAPKTMARHTETLSHEDFIMVCDRLLKPHGLISIILPSGRETDSMIAIAARHGFAPSRLTVVHSTPKSGPKRTLIELSRRATANPDPKPATHSDTGLAPAASAERGTDNTSTECPAPLPTTTLLTIEHGPPPPPAA
ncbi:MAG: hypothetical protein LBV18_00415, partial [Alistipes sp.]|nr:hypothetical protein [Alistipes sp.]